MRFLYILTILLSPSLLHAQADEKDLDEIRKVFKEAQLFLKGSPEVIMNNCSSCAESTIEIYANENRIYAVKHHFGYEGEGYYEREYYFNEKNEPVFIFEKADEPAYYEGLHKYSEQRIYIRDGKIIRQLEKSVENDSHEVVENFKKNVENEANTTVSPSKYPLVQKARKLVELYKIQNGLQ